MVVALDEDTKSHAESHGFTSLIMDLKVFPNLELRGMDLYELVPT